LTAADLSNANLALVPPDLLRSVLTWLARRTNGANCWASSWRLMCCLIWCEGYASMNTVNLAAPI